MEGTEGHLETPAWPTALDAQTLSHHSLWTQGTRRAWLWVGEVPCSAQGHICPFPWATGSRDYCTHQSSGLSVFRAVLVQIDLVWDSDTENGTEESSSGRGGVVVDQRPGAGPQLSLCQLLRELSQLCSVENSVP